MATKRNRSSVTVSVNFSDLLAQLGEKQSLSIPIFSKIPVSRMWVENLKKHMGITLPFETANAEEPAEEKPEEAAPEAPVLEEAPRKTSFSVE